MKKISIYFSILLILSTNFALALNCADISGVYQAHYGELRVSQVDCKKVSFQLVSRTGQFIYNTRMGDIAYYATKNKPYNDPRNPGLLTQEIDISNSVLFKFLPSKTSELNILVRNDVFYGSDAWVYTWVITFQPHTDKNGNKTLKESAVILQDYQF